MIREDAAMHASRRVSLVLAAVTTFALPTVAHSQQAAIYSSLDRFHPVIAQNGMVASQEATATEVGVDILRRGGNAVDAAVAVGFTLAVTLPRAGNIGGGGFMLVHLAGSGETVAIDYRERAPAASDRDMYLDAEGNADPELSRFTQLAVGVPGTVAGLALAHERYGSGTFTLAELMQPAIDLAENGIPVTGGLANSLADLRDRLTRWPTSAAIFYRPDGSDFDVGDTLVQADLAQSLRQIAEQGPAAFYDGPIGEAIVAELAQGNGIMTLDDLRAYEAVVREPVTGDYRGYRIASMPPPSSGGIHIVQILNILEDVPVADLGHNSAQTIHWMAEAMKLAYVDRSEYLGDPDYWEVPMAGLTSQDYADALRAGIDPDHARPAAEIGPGDPAPYESPQTTHFSVVDADGNAVANTYTLNFSYGTGLVAGGTGILLNNELDDFSAKPGVPNAYGLIGGDANAVAPNKRPLSSMSPTFVFDPDGRLFLVTGSPGGSRIITTTLQVIMNVIDHGMNIAEATNAVRIHHQWLPDELRIEEGLSPDTIRLLEGMGHTVVVRDAMGSTQSIMVTDGGFAGASDPRQPDALTLGY
ncbi:MAG: gamma-glutamyltransferase [Rhodospirillaceae bacterium]|nr:gamma-glutamyltransferase [Rhodospirillaceae bacterium]